MPRYTIKRPIQHPAIIPSHLAIINPYEINNILLGNGVRANYKVPNKYPYLVFYK